MFPALFSSEHCSNIPVQRRKKPPKNEDKGYRNITAQNQWLAENLFDSSGQLLYHSKCVTDTLGISKQRLGNLAKRVKLLRSQTHEQLTKQEIEETNRQCDIVAPSPMTTSLMDWWTSLPPTELLTVTAHPERHGLSLKPSNHAKKPETLRAFLIFVDNNRTPTDEHDGIQVTYVLNDRLRRLLDAFNREQQERGAQSISEFTARSWLQKWRPNTSIALARGSDFDPPPPVVPSGPPAMSADDNPVLFQQISY
eukprot:TRINITY_DN1420_c0_g1_i1.p1 TRINITY_DN1420_c0_g1~~TRINITY_DN1420_c0_g1_i1.p1  ORF type:complete len:253 (+),score=53.98 TRINITY_DN1420_c0_g1_i1:582-1340(+)